MIPLIPIAIIGVAAYGAWRYFNPSAPSAAAVVEETVTNIEQSITDLFPKAAPYADTIQAAQDANGIPNNYLAKLLATESSFDPAIISGQRKSRVGAVGIAQFMPKTAQELGVDPTNPTDSINGAAAMLKRLYEKFGSWSTALAAYNWGEGNVARKGLTNAPIETVNYVQKIAGVDITQPGA